MNRPRLTFFVCAYACLSTCAGSHAATTTFDHGTEGWGLFFANDGVLGDFLEPTGGNPTHHLRWTMIDTFGATFHNASQSDFLGDYSRFSDSVRIGVDIKVDDLSFFGSQVARNLILELVDYNAPGSPWPWTSVWFNLGEVSLDQTFDWSSFAVTITDPTSTELPAGWGGTGAEDPVTFEPVLPHDRTFASVLANVEEIRFTTFEPGYFYGFTNFQLRFDNPTVAAVPEPGIHITAVMLAFQAARRGRKTLRRSGAARTRAPN